MPINDVYIASVLRDVCIALHTCKCDGVVESAWTTTAYSCDVKFRENTFAHSFTLLLLTLKKPNELQACFCDRDLRS